MTPAGPGQFLPSLDAPRRRWRELSFAVRLFAGLGATLLLVGAAAFVLLTERLEQHEIESFARVQRADARGFEELAREHDRRIAVREIGQVLDAIGRRPGMIDASLIDPRGIVVASSRESLVGTPHRTEQIMQALRRGAERYGRAEDPGEESSAFEFVTPVGFPDARYAVEVGTNSESFDEQTAGIREVLALVLVLALVAISVLFYLLGGRSLLRSHRLALQRSTLDGLTDLPNQRAFQSDLEQAVALAARDNGPVALAVLDVDQFKLVNDRNGHIQGDALLKAIAAVLREGRSADRPYRIGGDEFALLLPNTDGDGACTVLRRLGRALAGAGASVSIGVATLRSGERSGELRAEADAALYEAKRRGGNRTVHFDELRGEVTVTTADKREAVRRLVDEGRLTTLFQPIWDFGSGTLVGIEALSRPHDSYGFTGPAEAFHVAAQAGAVHELDELCASSALAAAADNAQAGDAALFLNVAPKTLELDAGQSDWLLTAVDAAGLAPERVVIEVTEQLGSRVASVVKSLEALRAHGFKLALDDVGTGNAGLEMLRKVDADFVKIDRSIVSAAPIEPNARAVLLAMATFARQTGAFVIAEGIEDEETLAFLRSIDERDFQPGSIIQGGQGFELGRPAADIPAVPAARWLRSSH